MKRKGGKDKGWERERMLKTVGGKQEEWKGCLKERVVERDGGKENGW